METRPLFIVYNSGVMRSEPVAVQDLLRQVSRSFYLTVHILPRSIKGHVGLAYLLARAADTVADTQLVPVPRRHQALLQLRWSIREACEGRTAALPDFGDLGEAREMRERTAGEGTPAERTLLQRLGELLDLLRASPPDDRLRTGKLLDTIMRGQETDLVRFGAARDRIGAFDTDEELDGYAYDVAGCVGEFWTEMCRAHVFPSARLDEARLRSDGVRFGKGLQLVNILRDIAGDLRRGRCYIPRARLADHGLDPGDLLVPGAMDRFRPLYDAYLRQAEGHLAAGWQYTVALPFRYARLRLACAWPVLIGVRTLGELRVSNVLDGAQRIKIGRPEIRRLLLRSVILYPNPHAWKRQFDGASTRSSAAGSRQC